MVFVGVLLGVAVLAALAVWALRRRGTDEMHSVAGYQDRLERLEELRRRQGGSVRIIGSTDPLGGPDRPPVVGEDGRIEISSSTARRRVVEDPVLGAPEPGDRPPPTYRRRSRDVSIARMSHRPRRLGAPIAAAVAVIVLVTGLAIAGAHSRPPHSTSTSTTTRKGHKSVTPPTSTTTTAPATFAPSSTSGSDVTYTLPFSSYTVTFNATTGACYIQITDSTGSTPYAAVLNQGQTKQIVLTGTSKVQLGAPSHIAVQVDRTPVTLPTPLPATLNITFAGAAPSATSTT